jgi:cytoskeletal protein CcmA (bactofilin family)
MRQFSQQIKPNILTEGGYMFKQGKKLKTDDKLDVENDATDDSTTVPNKTLGKKQFSGSINSSGREKTTIGENIIIEGIIQGAGNLIIEGVMKGDIQLEKHNFEVGPKGRVEGEIRANDVVISGLLHGKVKAQGMVKITKDADFYGSIKANSISIEDGAFFKGEIELGLQPHKKKDLVDKPINETGPKGKHVSNIPPVEATRGK